MGLVLFCILLAPAGPPPQPQVVLDKKERVFTWGFGACRWCEAKRRGCLLGDSVHTGGARQGEGC